MSGRGAERILELIEWLAGRSTPATLAEITNALTLPKSSTLLLMRTLVARGYVARGPDGLYLLQRLPGEPSARRPAFGSVLRIIEPILREAVELSCETGFVAVLTEGRILYLNKLLPDREIRYDRDITKARIPHEVASGIILLGGLGDAEIEAYLAELEPEKRELVRTRILAGRSQGVFVNLAGVVEGAAGIAAPVRARDGRMIAAINISGPRERIAEHQQRLKTIAMTAAEKAGNELATHAARFSGNIGMNDHG